MTDQQRRTYQRILAYVYRRTDVLPWLVTSGNRRAFVVEARALAAMLFRGSGFSYRRTAAALKLKSPSSVYELIQAHRLNGRTRKLALGFAEDLDDKTAFDADKAFGNSMHAFMEGESA